MAITVPSRRTAWADWFDAGAIATAVPGGPVPPLLYGVSLTVWEAAPCDNAGWEALAQHYQFPEPPFCATPGKGLASGTVAIEPDGRVWIVSPTNRFGGYCHTFPKGKIEQGMPLSLKANALKETYEETGLQVELLSFLTDVTRTTSTTRYYLARRIAGSPADMGWESQAVHMATVESLRELLKNPNDRQVVAALYAVQRRL
ncbi:MAG TPA: NUDIX hydrolase [Noviherbaspirillum sp.]|nr:NUDIX hydrolase [Noviherbaspirillum sp.]